MKLLRKKSLFLLSAVAMSMMAFSSCNLKTCYCYERTSSGVVEEERTTSEDNRCSALNTSRQDCIESYERGSMNPGDIAYAPAPKQN